MEARSFFFTIHHARDLVDVRTLGEMKVYAKVSIAGKSQYTKVDPVNQRNPEWNTSLWFLVPEKDIVQGNVSVAIELFCERNLLDDKYVGELNLTVAPLNKGEYCFPVRRNDSKQSKSFGTLKFSYELGDKILVDPDSSLSSSSSSSLSSSSSSSKDYSTAIKTLKIVMEVANSVSTGLM